MILLASSSPRRREILEMLGLNFKVIPSSADETVPKGLSPAQTVEYLSGIKAEAVFKKHLAEAVTVIGSDTVVIADGVIYGKPTDRDDAFRMLRALSGKTHQVMTGVTILRSDGNGECIKKSFTSTTDVWFYDLTDEEIRDYIDSGEPMDKAGAYGIQGQGVFFVEKIDGDYNTVVGFPLAAVGRVLSDRG